MNDSIEVDPAKWALAVGLLNAVGASLKAVPKFPNWSIPLMLAAIGSVAYASLTVWTGAAYVVGATAGFAAVGLHQGVVQVRDLKRLDGTFSLAWAFPLLCGLLLIGAGCASLQQNLTPAKTQRLVAFAIKQTTKRVIENNPYQRANFEKSLAGVEVLIANETWDSLALADALTSSGAEVFQSDTAELVVDGPILLIDLLTGDSVDAAKLEYLKAFVYGARDGLIAGLATAKPKS